MTLPFSPVVPAPPPLLLPDFSSSRIKTPVTFENCTAEGQATPAMHWSRIPLRKAPPPLRAHTTTVVGTRLFVFAGCDAKVCYENLWIFDTETLWWTKPKTKGDKPKPCRAHSAGLVGGRWIVIFGGGDGPHYYNDFHILDTHTLTWSKPLTNGNPPSPRRAHTAWVYKENLYIYAGGDGVRALNDLFMLNTSILTSQTAPNAATFTWTHLNTKGVAPLNRGYHTTNLIHNTDQVILFGGSDGHECFSDVHILNLSTLTWSTPALNHSLPRLSHTATQVGSYLFILGGHDGSHYNSTILLLNLVTMNWETRTIHGKDKPDGRGYHTAVLCDSRLWVFGGYDGGKVFGDCWVLELGASAYLPQITSFEVAGGEES